MRVTTQAIYVNIMENISKQEREPIEMRVKDRRNVQKDRIEKTCIFGNSCTYLDASQLI
jgi:hypothetical protein